MNRAYETTLAEGVRFERRAVPLHVRDRRPEGRHGRLHREAKAAISRTNRPAIDSPSRARAIRPPPIRISGRPMPNIASSKKRVRTIAKRTAINHARKTRIRTFTRKVEEALDQGRQGRRHGRFEGRRAGNHAWRVQGRYPQEYRLAQGFAPDQARCQAQGLSNPREFLTESRSEGVRTSTGPFFICPWTDILPFRHAACPRSLSIKHLSH